MSLPRYAEYVATSAPWLRAIPGHWFAKPLKRCVSLLTEKTDQRAHSVGLENIESRTGRLIETDTTFEGDGVAFESGDILFGKLRPYLAKVHRTTRAGEAVGDFHVLRPHAGFDGTFVRYQLLDQPFIAAVDASTYGSKMPRAGWEFMGGMLICVPPLEEQAAIAAFLDRETAKIDALVEEQRRLITLLFEKRQATISGAVTRGLNPNVALKASGHIWSESAPSHWRCVRMRYLFRLAKRPNQDGKEVLSVYRDHGVVLKNSRDDNFNKTPEDLSGYQLVAPRDLVVNKMKAWQGSLGISPYEGITSPDYLVFSPLHHENPGFIHALLRSHGLVSVYRGISNGIRLSQWRLEVEQFLNVQVFLPPVDEQDAIASYVEAETARSMSLGREAEQAIALLLERRTALITAAVTGQIDVRSLAPSESP